MRATVICINISKKTGPYVASTSLPTVKCATVENNK